MTRRRSDKVSDVADDVRVKLASVRPLWVVGAESKHGRERIRLGKLRITGGTPLRRSMDAEPSKKRIMIHNASPKPRKVTA